MKQKAPQILHDLLKTWKYSTGGSMYDEYIKYFNPRECVHILPEDAERGNCIDVSVEKGLSWSSLNELQKHFLVTIEPKGILHLEAFTGLPKAFNKIQVES